MRTSTDKPKKPAHILVVEDDYNEAAVLSHFLEDWGHTVPAVVSTAEKALAEAENHSLDLALVDIRLPGEMDGVELAEALLKSWRVPSLFVSGYTDEETLDRVSTVPSRGFISKPFMPEGLRSSIEVALRQNNRKEASQNDGAPPYERLTPLATLCGGVSRQLNNLLTVVMGSAGLLRESVEHDEDARLRLAQIEEAVRAAGHVTQQMLIFSRECAFTPVPVDIDVAAAECAQQFTRSGCTVQLDLHADGALIEADPVLLRVILMNLLRNAEEAAGGKGTVQLRTQRACTAPEAGRSREISGVGVTIVDDGNGMRPEIRKRAFEPFFTTKGAGRGLGLATALGAATRHGGTIAFESQPGQGTAVYLWLPEKPGGGSALQAPENEDADSLKTILVVDDEPMVLNTVEMLLKNLGYRVVTAVNGRDALDVATEYCSDIDGILLDLVMPVMTGEEALPELRLLCPQAPVIVLTGFAQGGGVSSKLEEQVYAVLNKPVRRAELAATLKGALATVR